MLHNTVCAGILQLIVIPVSSSCNVRKRLRAKSVLVVATCHALYSLVRLDAMGCLHVQPEGHS